jgi:hypothetical protein
MDSLRAFLVPLRNEHTGEQAELTIISDHPANAQKDALTYMFKEYGWRKVLAQLAIASGEAR